jgi:hypothetical protein
MAFITLSAEIPVVYVVAPMTIEAAPSITGELIWRPVVAGMAMDFRV